ncbi:MAG TPA: AMP-binding protein, partial [Acidimicrobiales bacterium]|nr:AMP-binding protein [Acidimicrobiales bacterium]
MDGSTSHPAPPSTITAALERAAAAFEHDEAVVDGTTRWTFGQLLAESTRIARALVASDVGPGDRVALWAPNSARWIAASFGVYLAGGVLVPINTRFKGTEAGHVLRRSGAGLLLASTDTLGTDLVGLLDDEVDLPALLETIVTDGPTRSDTTTWDAFVARDEGHPLPDVDATDLADIVFTSGTTGAPKGAMLAHGPSVRTYEAWSDAVGLRRGDRYLCVYPFFHTAGLKSAVLACVLRGATVLPHAVFEPGAVMRRVEDEQISVLPGPPTVFQSILEHRDRQGFDLSTLRLSVTGAASVPVEVVRRMRADLGIATVVTGYGLTETTGTVSMCRHDDPPEVVARTVGKPLAGVSVRVVTEQNTDAGAGEPGEILVKGFNVTPGYFDDPEATAEAIDADGWLRTGDIGLIDDDGNLHITDRKKDMFIVGGFNAYPAEIEGLMLTHPDVALVAVVGVPDDRLGEVGQA